MTPAEQDSFNTLTKELNDLQTQVSALQTNAKSYTNASSQLTSALKQFLTDESIQLSRRAWNKLDTLVAQADGLTQSLSNFGVNKTPTPISAAPVPIAPVKNVPKVP